MNKIILLFFSAAALALSFSRYNCNFLAWVALAPLLFVVSDGRKTGGFWWGFLFGVFFYFGNIYWISHTLVSFGGLPIFLSILVLSILVSYLALYYGLLGWFTKKLYKKYPVWGLFCVPFIWVGLEWVRSFFLTGFPWSLLGYSQHNFLPIIQVSEYTGVYGVSFLIVLANVLIAHWFLGGCSKKRLIVESFVCVFFILAATFWGSWRIRTISRDMLLSGSVTRASFVQGNIDQSMKWDQKREKEIVGIYDSLTRKVAESKPDFVLWPETAVPFLYQNNPKYRKWLEALSASTGVPIVTGAMTYNFLSREEVRYYNSSIMVTPDKNISKIYDKMHLVPFGEYVPLKKFLFFVEKLVDVMGELSTGTGTHVRKLGSFSFGTVICFEIIFPDLVRRFADNGAKLIMNLTNDAWYGDTDAPFQHWAMAAFRSVENRVWVARAANTGISGFISPCGKPVLKSEIFSRGVGTFDVKILSNYQKTFYTRFGDIFAKACFIILLMCSVCLLLKRK